MNEPKTLTITNFGGPLTRKNDGDIDSGLAKFDTSWGYDPFSKPGNLTWMEQPTSILTGVLPVAMKQRTEGTGNNVVNYVYAIGTDNNLRKFTSNSSSGADIDTSSVISTMDGDSYTGGGGMTFYGATEKIFLGGDQDIQKVNFNGSSSSVIGSTAAELPRPFITFMGKIYFGNGNNIGEIDSTEVITTMGKLSPALPSGMIVKDLDISTDGNYLLIIASRTNPLNAVGGGNTAGDIGSSNASDSYRFYWNGIDAGATAVENYSGLVLSANVVHSEGTFMFGYDLTGTAIFAGTKKTVSLPEALNPLPNAVFAVGNRINFATPEYDTSTGRFNTVVYSYGQYDDETPKGLFRLLKQGATVRVDTVAVPACINVSNRMHLPVQFGYTNNLAGNAKLYYSVTEAPSVVGAGNIFKTWRFNTAPNGKTSIVAGVYETQSQLFSKKVAVKEVRLYTDPLVGGNSFTVDLIGSGGSVLSGSSQNFTVGTNVTTLDDLVRYNPASPPTYAVGVRITNASVTGVANWTANKLEIDYVEAGK